MDIFICAQIHLILYEQFTRWFNILLIDDVVDAHNVVIVHVFVAGNADDKHDDFRTDDAMLLVVYKYQMLLLNSCKLPAI